MKAITSYSANLLAYPYPAATASEETINGVTFRQMSDGSIILNGTAERNVSYFLYTDRDGLALPETGVYIDTEIADGVLLYVKSGSSGAVWKNGAFYPSKNDEYFGSYEAYVYIKSGTVTNNLRITPSITYGTRVRHAVPYHAPHRIEIPDEVTSLPGYGWYENVLDLENGCYRQRRDENGTGLTDEVIYPLPEAFLASLTFPVYEGGYIDFEVTGFPAVESTITYVTRAV